MRPVCLLDPYGQGRQGWIYADDLVDRAALAECLRLRHRLRWHFGQRAACAGCYQDAVTVMAAMVLLPRTALDRRPSPSLGGLQGLVCIR
jgi:hypothetical protein